MTAAWLAPILVASGGCPGSGIWRNQQFPERPHQFAKPVWFRDEPRRWLPAPRVAGANDLRVVTRSDHNFHFRPDPPDLDQHFSTGHARQVKVQQDDIYVSRKGAE